MPETSLTNSFDLSPEDLPAPPSQPEVLAVFGRVRGMEPADPTTARVLELGCASGGNLLPLAERYPGATYLGIDSSRPAIELARQAASDLGLANIEFVQEDIRQFEPSGTFDYIIASGVYSWVEADVHNKLLAICREALAPQGIVYVSYKTYPGCRLRDMLRAMMLYEARGATTPQDQVARARDLLSLLESSLADDKPYNTMVRSQAAALLKQSDAQLRHGYVEPVSPPVYFRQFMAHAKSHALWLLGDAVLGIRWADSLGPQLEEQLSELASDPVEKEQYRDVLRNRGVRQTLLCHEGVSLRPLLEPELLSGMFLESRLRCENPTLDVHSTGIDRFVAANGLRVSTAVPLVKAALARLGSIWPNQARFDDLVSAACSAIRPAGQQAGSSIAESEIDRLRQNFAHCCAGGIIDVHSQAQAFTTQVASRPLASPLARWQAQRGDVATNRRHRAIRLEYLDRHVLPLLDGTRDASQVLDQLAAWTADGRLSITEGTQAVHSPERAREILAQLLPQSLKILAQNAFLVG